MYDNNNKEVAKLDNEVIVIDSKMIIGNDISDSKIALYNSETKKMLTETLLEIKSKGFDECGLEVKPDNLNAISIYQTLGFESKEIQDNIIKMHKYM